MDEIFKLWDIESIVYEIQNNYIEFDCFGHGIFMVYSKRYNYGCIKRFFFRNQNKFINKCKKDFIADIEYKNMVAGLAYIRVSNYLAKKVENEIDKIHN